MSLLNWYHVNWSPAFGPASFVGENISGNYVSIGNLHLNED